MFKKIVVFYSGKMKPTELTCYIYEVGICKKDLHLSVNLHKFDSSKLSLVVDELNPDKFKVLYSDKKFHLFVEKLYGKVKKSRAFEDTDYLNIKDDCSVSKKMLYEVFFAIKELVTGKVDMCSFVEWNRIWLGCTEYDLTNKHSYHFEKMYLAVDSVVCVPDPYFKNYKLGCELVQGNVYLCEKCDTFLL